MQIQLRSGVQLDTSIVPYADREELQVIAHAVHDGRIQSAGFAETRQTVDVEAEEIQTATGQTLPVRSGIRLSIYGVVLRRQTLTKLPARIQAQE